MLSYVIKKVLLAIPLLLGVSVLVFMMMHLIPGDAARIIAGPEAFEEDVQALRVQLGLDKPLPVQYWMFLSRAVHGDFGHSIRSTRLVSAEIKSRFPATVELAVVATGVSLTIGLVSGIVAATRQNSFLDTASMGVALLGISIPGFWLGLMLMLVFSYYLHVLPASGRGGSLLTLSGWRYIALPALSLGVSSAASIARMTRSSMLEVLRQDYVRTARAKGLAERVVVYTHALKNAMIPVVTLTGLHLGFLLGGAVITEQVFAWPGLGTLVVNAIWSRDFPIVQGVVMLFATTFTVINLLVDLTYALFDPRVRYE